MNTAISLCHLNTVLWLVEKATLMPKTRLVLGRWRKTGLVLSPVFGTKTSPVFGIRPARANRTCFLSPVFRPRPARANRTCFLSPVFARAKKKAPKNKSGFWHRTPKQVRFSPPSRSRNTRANRTYLSRVCQKPDLFKSG